MYYLLFVSTLFFTKVTFVRTYDKRNLKRVRLNALTDIGTKIKISFK